MNKRFENPILEILNFSNDDIIVTSSGSGEQGVYCPPNELDCSND